MNYIIASPRKGGTLQRYIDIVESKAPGTNIAILTATEFEAKRLQDLLRNKFPNLHITAKKQKLQGLHYDPEKPFTVSNYVEVLK